MNKKRLGVLATIGMLAVSLLTGCGTTGHTQTQANNKPPASQVSLDDQAREIVSKMDDKQKIGQLMMIGIQGTSMDMTVNHLITDYKFGNIIFFDRNMDHPDKVKALSSALRSLIQKNSGVSPFIALDQEGGQVLRMREHFPAVPSEADLGQQDSSQAKDWALKTGNELMGLGITVDFAPVVDLGLARGRSYSSNPDAVIAYAEQACEGYKESGVFNSLKHFPGIGKAKIDPHIDGDSVTISREQMEKEDLKPFRELIKRVDPNETFIMVSNVTYPQLDNRYPACISEKIVTDLLRKEYGYKGLILSDDMEMGAMAKHYSFEQMGVMAIKAGVDIVLVCQEYEHEKEVYNGLLKAYQSGEISKEMIDEKVIRIVKTKLSHKEIECLK